MTRSGFVLVGGASRRMGRDKALLSLDGITMVEAVAAKVRAAAGNVTLIGPVEKYANLGFPVVPDAVENCGPIGGLYTALQMTSSDWNVLVACDMPHLTVSFLNQLFAAAENDGAVPETAGKIHPSCAVYHRSLLAVAKSAINRKLFKMQDFIATLQMRKWSVPDPEPLANVNTPVEYHALH
jgi:molybdopterin-guanine dinucleotide biosynthesis protein A